MQIQRTMVMWIALLGLGVHAAGAVPAGIDVRVGWGNTYRAGRWNPIYITAASNPPREVVAHVEGVHSAPHAMSVANRFALSPSASTHAVFFPLGESSELRQTSLLLRDAATGKRIAAMNLALTPPLEQAPLGQPLIGVSGEKSTWALLKDQFAGDATVGYEELPYLPVVAAGYDALDVLVLNAPDLSKVDAKRQEAIVDWLRAGGTLWMWPGASATPATGPLIEALPALMGENQLIELDPASVAHVGLARVAKIQARQLSPIEGIEPVPLIGSQVVAFRRSVGFGQIVLAPIDLATLRFTSNLAVQKFWSPMLRGVPDRTRDNIPEMKVARWLREADAARTRIVPAWLIFALVIVGPIDGLLLKLLGRRPWTVVTVLGWGGLIAAVTYNAREHNRERRVEYRTVRVTDEVDQSVAMVTDFVGVRWPQGSSLTVPRQEYQWWQPAIDPTDPPNGAHSEFVAEQSEGGTWPARMAAHVPTPRVLQAQKWTASPGLIEAKLSPKGDRVVGTITNRGERPLINVRIRIANGVAQVGGAIAPGGTFNIDAPVEAKDRSLDIPPAESFFEARRSTDTPILLPDYGAIEASTFARSTRIVALLRRGRACVYAQIDSPVPPSDLPAPKIEKHLAFVRSLVRLE
ncbi:MAG: hypothetical protein M3478_11730 [Planctomycetota bacterium]|nr:hypothetical protein [Planctomycetota bacterium]